MAELKCPVCSVRFRGARICSRCGADLSVIMRLAALARAARRRARRAILAGDYSEAVKQASLAQSLHATAHGRGLALLAELLAAPNQANQPMEKPPHD